MHKEFEDERLGYQRLSDYVGRWEEGRNASTWMRQALEVALRNPKLNTPPEYWKRDDGKPLIYHNRAHSFVGEAESLKSWAALMVVIDFARQGLGVLYVDCESTLDVFAQRMLTVVPAIEAYKLEKYIAYIRPDEPLWDRVWNIRERKWDAAFTNAAEEFEQVGRAYQANLLIVDGVTEIMALHNLDINQATDVATYHRMFLRRWPGEITTLEIDHVAKGDFSGESGGATSRGAIGSQHKRAGIDGAAYLFSPVQKGGHGGVSSSRVSLIKDREGGVRTFVGGGGDVGLFVLDSSSLPAKCEVQAVTGVEDDDLSEMILRALEGIPMGSKALAEYLNKPVGRVRKLCLELSKEGLILRGDKEQWHMGVDAGLPI